MTMKKSKHILTAMVGATILAFGVAMVMLVGVAWVVIPAVLGILTMEFERIWRWLRTAIHVLP